VTTTVKVAHIRLCHSRMFLVQAYPRETQEMVFDAHDHALRLLGGMYRRGIYDNMTTAVEAVFAGKERRFNRRFLALCSHYLVEPTARTLVRNLRCRLFEPERHTPGSRRIVPDVTGTFSGFDFEAGAAAQRSRWRLSTPRFDVPG
jgi:hypothetical protein